MSDPNPAYDTSSISGPRIVAYEPPQNSIIGTGLGEAGGVVRVYGDQMRGHLGLLPEEVVMEAPHIDEMKTVTPKRRDDTGSYPKEVVPLDTAPDEYLSRVKRRFHVVTWLSDAELYVKHNDVNNMEAIIMAVAEDIDTVGSGQAERIGRITGWGTDTAQRILEDLLMSKQRRCRKEQEETDGSEGW